MRLQFTKMQGVGNDYIYLDARQSTVSDPAALAVQLADRHFGVGGDGLVLLQNSAVADVKMAMFNADGSEGLMCGNAVRCVAHYLVQRGEAQQNVVRIETKSGIKEVRRIRENFYRVKMGVPEFSSLPLADVTPLTIVNVGNPHVVIFPSFAIDDYDISRLGKRLEHSPLFPGGTNVEFVRVVGDNTLQMRVWERGSGETLGCGTGAVAAAVASVVRGYCNREKLIKVRLPGGELLVDYATDQANLLGPAETVFTGSIQIKEENHAH